MKQFMKKVALFLALVLVITSIPVSAKAATKPSFRTKKTTVYENSSANGVYKYTVSGVQKGYTVKWGITGTGKKYVTLKYKTTKATKTTTSNQITINTDGKTEAKNVKFVVYARVYDKSGRLITTVKDKPTIKICAKTLTISTEKIGTLDGLSTGEVYDFDAAVTPVNATSEVYWTVTASDGTDHSSEITSEGVWTPKQNGEYTIKAEARNSATSKVLCQSSVKASVGAYIKAVTQTGANELKVVFSTDVTDKLTADNVTIEAKAGTSTLIPKDFDYDTVGKTVTITTYTNFKNNTEYVLSYGSASTTFKASVGEPVSAKILTETVPANTLVAVKYALYDSNGVDVKNACTGELTLDGEVTNGTLADDGILYMTTPGKKATITLTYVKADGSKLTATKTIICVEETVEEAVKTDFTITSSDSTPDYDDEDYKAVNYIALEGKGYAHFRALNSEGEEITYDTVKFSSSNDNVLIVTEDGELTPIKTGTVKVFVTVTKGDSDSNFTFNVSVKEAKKLTSVSLSTTSVTMSNASEEDYQKTIDVTAYDQYKDEYDLSDDAVEIQETSSHNSGADVTFDGDAGQIIIKNAVTTGTHTYKVTVTIDGKSVSATFKLTVKEIPWSSNSVNYLVEATSNTVDTVVNKKTTGDKTVVIRLAQYRGGVFEKYVAFDSATIKKGSKYFTADLTAGGSTDQVTASDNDSKLIITAMKLATECKKAETGSYTVAIKYLNESTGAYKTTNATIKVTDTQEAPKVTVEKLASGKKVSTALDLVRECLSVNSGVIYDCTAVGEDATGSKIPVASGGQLHIKTVSVREEVKTGSSDYPVVYVYHTITVGKTLTNK